VSVVEESPTVSPEGDAETPGASIAANQTEDTSQPVQAVPSDVYSDYRSGNIFSSRYINDNRLNSVNNGPSIWNRTIYGSSHQYNRWSGNTYGPQWTGNAYGPTILYGRRLQEEEEPGAVQTLETQGGQETAQA